MAGSVPEHAALEAAGISGDAWWSSLLHAYHWAIQVGRNV
jgi:EAL and modified HD-GYP domain-containing signal transduction protein